MPKTVWMHQCTYKDHLSFHLSFKIHCLRVNELLIFNNNNAGIRLKEDAHGAVAENNYIKIYNVNRVMYTIIHRYKCM